jgi:sarcosine oxidase/L-pipecolate oxidase
VQLGWAIHALRIFSWRTNPMTEGAGPSSELFDLVVIGGGVMGMFTAWTAAQHGSRVAVLERGHLGDPATASYGRTRSYRRDYLDAGYARLADEAIRLWTEFETATGTSVLVRCGCLNIAKAAVTPDLGSTYATLSTNVMRRLGMPIERTSTDDVTAKYPVLVADLADLDPVGGLVNLPAVTGALRAGLAGTGSAVYQATTVSAIERDGERLRISSSAGDFRTASLVVTAGHGTNDVLALLPGNTLKVPISKDRPNDAKYFRPPADRRHLFTSDVLPVIAYLDTGIYLHPIVDGLIDAVKIGYYNPPDMPAGSNGTTSIDSISDFVEQCLPGIAGSEVTQVSDVDQCDYDLVADDNFVLGAVPGFENVFVGVGWRGTGYKFAPWVGRVLFELALREGTVYDIDRFSPARFTTAASVEGYSRADPASAGRRLAGAIGAGEGFGGRTAVRE